MGSPALLYVGYLTPKLVIREDSARLLWKCELWLLTAVRRSPITLLYRQIAACCLCKYFILLVCVFGIVHFIFISHLRLNYIRLTTIFQNNFIHGLIILGNAMPYLLVSAVANNICISLRGTLNPVVVVLKYGVLAFHLLNNFFAPSINILW